MNPLCCPKCNIALTSAEAERGNCPSCGASLPNIVAREGASQLYGRSPGYASGARPDVDPDHIPQLARIGGWMVRIGGASMLFVIAACCGLSFLLSFVPVDPEEQSLDLGDAAIAGIWFLFGLSFITFLIGVALKILAGERERR